MSLKDTVSAFLGRRLNDKGQEVPDPTPVGLPLGYKHPPSLEQRIKTMIETTLSRNAAQDGKETWEEANDFDVGDPDDKNFPDEDDEVAPNDPYVQNAFEREEPRVRESLAKIKEEHDKKATKSQKAKPKAAPADDVEDDESE